LGSTGDRKHARTQLMCQRCTCWPLWASSHEDRERRSTYAMLRCPLEQRLWADDRASWEMG
jgi:hypothetical protein